MTRQVLAIDLKDDAAVKVYRDHHERVWPEVLDSLHNFGVLDMHIYLVGRRLVMIVDMQDGHDLRTAFAARVASHPRVAEWERLMTSLQLRVPGSRDGEWWAAMEPVFELHESARRV
jgi:L-rhamnose mutarotase